MTGTNNYERDFMLPVANKRGGRIDARLFQNIDDAGDGYPGLQKQIRNLIHQFHARYVLNGCTYDGSSTLSSGTIIWDNNVVAVAQQTITVNNSEFLYIDSAGVAHTTSVEATALANILIYLRSGAGVGEETIFKYYQNNLEIYKLAIHKQVDMNGHSIINVKYPTLDEEVANKKYVDDYLVSWAIMVDITDSIQDAVDTLAGIGGGYIYLEPGTHNTATDTFPIKINTTDVAIFIFGDGEATIVDPEGDTEVFWFAKAGEGVLRDLKIDATSLTSTTTKIVRVSLTGSDNRAIVENITIIGDGTNGIGINLGTDNLVARNCNIIGVNIGIDMPSWSTVQNCYFEECADKAIDLGAFFGRAENNHIVGGGVTNYGIYADSCVSVFITNNFIGECGEGIYATNVTTGIFSNNIISSCANNDATDRGAINILSGSAQIAINNNIILMNTNSGAGTTYGIQIASGCSLCDVGGNIMFMNDSDTINDNGTSTGFYVGTHLKNVQSIDNEVYFVSTPTEWQAAIDTIGSNAGMIILGSGKFDLSATINYDQAGSIITQGQGDKTIIDCNGDRTAIEVTSMESGVFRDFKVDANDVTTQNKPIIIINESSDNKIKCENIHIDGNAQKGFGILQQSDNCEINGCKFIDLYYGVYNSGANDIDIIGNFASGCYVGLYSNYKSKIIGNTCTGCNWGINATAYIVQGNHCYGNTLWGIHYEGTGGLVNGNTCNDNNPNSATSGGGIKVDYHKNTISGNTCYSNTNIGSGNATGIEITSSIPANENTVVGNTALDNDINYNNNGTNTFDSTATDGDPLNNFT